MMSAAMLKRAAYPAHVQPIARLVAAIAPKINAELWSAASSGLGARVSALIRGERRADRLEGQQKWPTRRLIVSVDDGDVLERDVKTQSDGMQSSKQRMTNTNIRD